MDLKKTVDIVVPSYIDKIVPYPPGKPIEELERELGISNSIKLASNENPFGPSPKALASIRKALGTIHRYPDGSGYYLRKRLAELNTVPIEGVLLGNGSDEILEMAVKAFMAQGDHAIVPTPTFLMYSNLVQTVGGEVIEVPLSSLKVDLDAVASAVTPKTKIIFLNNPNNPTGTAFFYNEFENFMNKVPSKILVILDEAYIEFVRDDNVARGINYIRTFPNLLMLRTFSKAYGLAGVRIGYGFTHPEIASTMNVVRQPFNANSLAQAGALGALEDDEFLQRTLEAVRSGVAFFYHALDKVGLEYIPTNTNFFLVKVGFARQVYEAMLRKGVIVRGMDSYGLKEYIRINVGLPEENERCMRALQEVMADLKDSRSGS